MPWWGKLLGGTLGFMLGGPLGALLGAALGHNFDRGITLTDEDAAASFGRQERVQAAFFTATFSIMGHIAKADGRVTRDEIDSAEAVMSQMQLNAAQRKAAIHLFNEGKQPGFPLDDVLQQFRRECQRRRNLLQMFIEIQILTAMADGSLHAAERAAIHDLGDRLGFSRHEIDHLFSMGNSGSGRGAARSAGTLEQAYAVLDISSHASDAEVKKAYRRLMSQHHPDKLIAKGLPEEMIKLANEKTQQIRAAYEQVMDSRRS